MVDEFKLENPNPLDTPKEYSDTPARFRSLN